MKTLSTLALAVLVASAPLAQAHAQDFDELANAPQTQLFSAQELDNLLAPVALYPDPILAQLLIAATFPDQIELANRYVRYYGSTRVDDQPWDISVRSVAHYPTLLAMMAERDDWTTAIGQAYAVQPGDVMASVQQLRQVAREQGNLVTTPEQNVIIEREVIRIVPAQPRVIYIPVYDPVVIYHRPVFHVGYHSAHWSFGIAFPIGSWLTYDCDWYGRRVYYDGWRGGGWRARSRPYIQVVNVYINPRYEVININRTVIQRQVNYGRLGSFNSVHREVTFANAERNAPRIANAAPRAPERYAVPRQQNAAERRLDVDAGATSPPARGRTIPQTQPRTAPTPSRAIPTEPRVALDQRSSSSRQPVAAPTQPRSTASQQRVVVPSPQRSSTSQQRVVVPTPQRSATTQQRVVVPAQPRASSSQERVVQMPQRSTAVVPQRPRPEPQSRTMPAPTRVIPAQPRAAQQPAPSRATNQPPPPRPSAQPSGGYSRDRVSAPQRAPAAQAPPRSQQRSTGSARSRTAPPPS